MNPQLKQYHFYNEMIADFASLSSIIDLEATLSRAPAFSFFTTDGRIHLGGEFFSFLVKLVTVTGIKINPVSSVEMPGVMSISYEDYAPVVYEEKEEKLEIKAVDTPAHKRSTRNKKSKTSTTQG